MFFVDDPVNRAKWNYLAGLELLGHGNPENITELEELHCNRVVFQTEIRLLGPLARRSANHRHFIGTLPSELQETPRLD